MPKNVVVANNKGGVGKSQVTAQLAAALARRELQVLVVDMDPQANVSRRLGVEYSDEAQIATMAEVIQQDKKGVGQGAVTPCTWETPEAAFIDVLPSRFDLLNREAEAGAVGAVRRLVKALDGWTDEYDVVLIDTRPDLGHIVQMSLAAADSVLLVTEPEYDGVEAAVRVRDFVAEHAVDITNPNLTIGGVVVNKRKATAEHAFQLEGLTETFGDLVWSPYLPSWSRFAEADAAAASLSAWRDDRGRQTTGLYDELAQTFIKRIIEG